MADVLCVAARAGDYDLAAAPRYGSCAAGAGL